MGKKKFIEKKKSAVYQVVHRPYDEQEQGDERRAAVTLRPKNEAPAVDENLNAVEAKGGMGGKTAEDVEAEYVAGEEAAAFEADEVELLRRRVEESGFQGRDYDADGLLIDGYDYSKHLRPIGVDPSAVFLPAGGGQVGAKDVRETAANREAKIKAERFEVLFPAMEADKEDDDILNAMEMLDDDDFDADEEWGGEINDDFIVQATVGKGYEKILADESNWDILNDDGGSGGGQPHASADALAAAAAAAIADREADEAEDGSSSGAAKFGAPAGAANSLMEARFEELLKEYDDDEIGDLDEQVENEGGMDASEFNDVIDDFLETGPFNVFQKPETFGTKPNQGPKLVRVGKYAENGTKENPYEILDNMRRKANEDGLAKLHGDAIQETEDETNQKLDGMLKQPRRQEWDCETILTTYSNLENHPRVIREPSRARIGVDKRGMPIDLEEQARAESAAHESNYGDEDDDDEEGEEGEEVIVVPNERQRGESAEEKRARKKAVKEARKARRQTKKSTKEAFKGEQMSQVRRAIQNQKNPVHVQL